MTFASYIRRERVVRMRYFGGKIFACPAVDWQATGREKLFTNYKAFSFPWVAKYSKTFKLYLFLRSSKMSTPTKGKRNTWSTAEENDFLLLCKERAIADHLEDSAICIKRSSKYCLCGKSQHDAVTLKRAPCWIAVAKGNIHIKTSQEQKYDANHIYELFSS